MWSTASELLTSFMLHKWVKYVFNTKEAVKIHVKINCNVHKQVYAKIVQTGQPIHDQYVISLSNTMESRTWPPGD
jgi:hypothetical protein